MRVIQFCLYLTFGGRGDEYVELFCVYICAIYRPVGWSGDGGVRERMRVELTSGGGAFPAWGMGGAL